MPLSMLFLSILFSAIIDTAYFANLAGYAYCNESVLIQNNCAHCSADFEYVKRVHVDGQNLVAVVMKNRTHYLLAFQGTRNLQDFLIDIQILLVPLSKFPFYESELDKDYEQTAKVHLGFQNGYKRLRKVLWEIMRHCHLPVVIVGHSMGASLATIAAVDLSQSFSVQLITAASPRTGNWAFVQLLQSRVPFIYRMTNVNDLVPFLPGYFLGYRHTENEIWVNNEETVLCDKAEDPKCINSQWPHVGVKRHSYIGNTHIAYC